MPSPSCATKPRVLCFIENSTSYKHLVRSKVLENAAGEPGFEFGVVVPPSLAPPPEDIERLPHVTFFTLNVHKARMTDFLGRALRKLFHVVARDLQTAHHPHSTLAQNRLTTSKRRLKNHTARMLYAKVLKTLGLRWRSITEFAGRFGRYPEIGALIDQFGPDVVMYFSLSLGQLDCLREAKRRRIPLVLDMPNWDHATSKGPMSVWPDHAFAWSKAIKEEFCTIQDFPADKTYPIGPLQFDCYNDANCPAPLSREEFCRLYDIDPSRKIILYAYGAIPGIDVCSPVLNEIVDILDEGVGHDCHLIFRTSPRVPIPSNISCRKNFTIQHPLGGHSPDGLGWISPPSEEHIRKSTIANSDVVINIFSTFGLDALCMEKPVINVGYVCGDPEDAPNRMERFYTYTHLVPVVRNPGIWFPLNKREFRQAIIEALENPKKKAVEARALYQQICGANDGMSWKRWQKALAGVIQLSKPS